MYVYFVVARLDDSGAAPCSNRAPERHRATASNKEFISGHREVTKIVTTCQTSVRMYILENMFKWRQLVLTRLVSRHTPFMNICTIPSVCIGDICASSRFRCKGARLQMGNTQYILLVYRIILEYGEL